MFILKLTASIATVIGTLLLSISAIFSNKTDTEIYKALKPSSKETEIHSIDTIKKIKDSMVTQNYMNIIGFSLLFIGAILILTTNFV